MPRRRRGAGDGAALADCCLQLVAHLGLGTTDRADVRRRSTAGGPAFQFPRGRHDVLLRRDEIVHLAAATATRHGTALRGRELLRCRLDLEEEDVAARLGGALAATDVSRAGVIAHEVARRDVEILEVHGVASTHRRRLAVAAERHHLLGPAADGVNEFERLHAVVVLGTRFERDFLESRRAAIARRSDDADVGRTVVHDSHEVLGVLAIADRIRIGQGDAIRAVTRHGECHLTLPLADHLQRQRPRALAIGRPEFGRLEWLGRTHLHRDGGAGRCIDVARVGLGARLQARERGIHIREVDALDAGTVERLDVVRRRSQPTGPYPVREAAIDRRNLHFVGATWRSRERADSTRTLAFDNELRRGHVEVAGRALDDGGDRQRCALDDAPIARRHPQRECRRRHHEPRGARRAHGSRRGHAGRDQDTGQRAARPQERAPAVIRIDHPCLVESREGIDRVGLHDRPERTALDLRIERTAQRGLQFGALLFDQARHALEGRVRVLPSLHPPAGHADDECDGGAREQERPAPERTQTIDDRPRQQHTGDCASAARDHARPADAPPRTRQAVERLPHRIQDRTHDTTSAARVRRAIRLSITSVNPSSAMP